MKRFYRIICGAAAVCIGLGAILGGVGLLLGGTLRGLFQGGGAYARADLPWSAPSWWGEETLRESYAGVRKLDFELGLSHVTIRPGEGFSLEARGVDSGRFRSRVDGDTWEIRCPEEKLSRFSSGELWGREAPEILITLPRDFVAEELELSMGMGTLEGEGLTALEAELSVGMGEMSLSGFSSGSWEADVGMGTLELEGALTGEGKLHCGMGSALLDLRGNEEDYNVSATAGLGRVTVAGRTAGGLGGELSWSVGAPNSIEIDCGMGEVSVTFQNDNKEEAAWSREDYTVFGKGKSSAGYAWGWRNT